MAPPAIEEEDYASSEDSDFAPDEAGDVAVSDASDDDEQDGQPAPEDSRGQKDKKRKRVAQDGDAEDAGFENSGDEAIIERGKKRRKKGAAKAGAAEPGRDEDDDEDGGIRIKTRSQRAVEKAERKIKAASGPVTIDVDALWAEMTSGAAEPPAEQVQNEKDAQEGSTTDGSPARSRDKAAKPGQQPGQAAGTDPPDTIRIQRTYNFAGKIHTEEKTVARDSAEAKLYLASLGDADAAQAAGEDNDGAARRMPRKAFRSAFEPRIEALLPRGDLNLAVSVRLQARAAAAARKLNTVEKSRMDWAGYVDREGIKDDLVRAGKAKDSFAERQDFLARSEARREEGARRLRLASKA